MRWIHRRSMPPPLAAADGQRYMKPCSGLVMESRLFSETLKHFPGAFPRHVTGSDPLCPGSFRFRSHLLRSSTSPGPGADSPATSGIFSSGSSESRRRRRVRAAFRRIILHHVTELVVRYFSVAVEVDVTWHKTQSGRAGSGLGSGSERRWDDSPFRPAPLLVLPYADAPRTSCA